MKSVAKKAKIGDVPRSRANRLGANRSTRPVAGFMILRTASNPNTSARTANTRGVQRRSVPSSDAVSPCPAAFWRAAAA